MVLDEPRSDDEVFEFGEVQVVVDRSSYFFVDEPLRIDFDEEEQVFRLRANTHVIPDKFKL
ncbi:MAG: iron-sulfur cluster biosynthesis family protein [Tumebacillaceae bacterium]